VSKERELLALVLSYVENKYLLVHEFEMATQIDKTFIEIKELLAKPEQEPVGVVETLGGYPDDSYHVVKLTCRHRDLRDGDLLYKGSPPKREPLRNGDIAAMFYAREIAICSDSYWAGIEDAEKAHGITGESNETMV
jgi:hypothetical protein